jgi:hypothetical protein
MDGGAGRNNMLAGARSRKVQGAHRIRQAGLGRMDKGTRFRNKVGEKMTLHEAATRWGAASRNRNSM